MYKKILLIACLSVLSSCGIVYNSRVQDMLKNAKAEDYGIQPNSNHQEIAQNTIKNILIDPESAQFKYWGPYQCAFPKAPMSPTPILGWCSTLSVNAKNRLGGYVGYKTYIFNWKNGTLYNYDRQI